MRIINYVTAQLLEKGFIVFSPISHCHHLAMEYNLPTDAKHWEEFNKRFLMVSQALLIITIPGWKESIGVQNEIEMAKSIFLIDPGTLAICQLALKQ